MGESSLLLAEASVGKNAERDSHEPGARGPAISSAAARVPGRGRRLWRARAVTARGEGSSDGPLGFETPLPCLVAQREFALKPLRAIQAFASVLLPKGIYFFQSFPALHDAS